VESNGSANVKIGDKTTTGAPGTRPARPQRRGRGRRQVYWGLLTFVVAAGLPMIGAPSLRARLKTRVETLRDAATGVPEAPAPVIARVGENHEPFPKEYEHPSPPPSYFPKMQSQLPRQPYRIVAGAPVTTAPAAVLDAPQPAVAPAGGAATAGQTPPEAGGEPQFKKGQTEQEAYDILVNSNQTLAGMIKGSDPKLKFQDWAAASLGGDSYYVMVTFVQASGNVPQKYIWRVRVQSKEVVPESSLARSISK